MVDATAIMQHPFRRTKKLLAQLSDQEEQKNTSFSQWLIEENGYKNLLAKHCALARLIAESIECWVNDTSLFLKRFHADNNKLHKTIAISSNPKIIEISIAANSSTNRIHIN